MIERVEEFHKEFVELVEHAERFCCAARGKEFQIEAIERLNDLKKRAKELKASIVAEGVEDLANRLFSYEKFLQAITNELRMWVALKEDRPDVAWDALVTAEGSALIAIQAHEVASHLHYSINRLKLLEQLLFPPMMFFSVGALIKRSTCTICEAEYGDCNHLKGKVYMGELCARHIREAEILECSIVFEPANKHCRISMFTENGVTRDILTWRVLETHSKE